MSPSPRGQIRAVPRREGEEAREAFQVDTANAAPLEMARFRPLNPFTVDLVSGLGIPGRPDLVSYSVEAIWQGLKLVDGEVDLEMLTGTPEKRPPESRRTDPSYRYEDSRFLLGEEILDLLAARRKIYVPAYLQMIERRLPDEVESEIAAARDSGREVLFYDWDENFNLADTSRSFSHSALLADWFGGRLQPVLDECDLSVGDHPRYIAHRARVGSGA